VEKTRFGIHRAVVQWRFFCNSSKIHSSGHLGQRKACFPNPNIPTLNYSDFEDGAFGLPLLLGARNLFHFREYLHRALLVFKQRNDNDEKGGHPHLGSLQTLGPLLSHSTPFYLNKLSCFTSK
jgi:hypothetical protein